MVAWYDGGSMITLEKIEELTTRTQAATFRDPDGKSKAMILDILARHRKSLLSLKAQMAECEEIETALTDLEAHLTNLEKRDAD